MHKVGQLIVASMIDDSAVGDRPLETKMRYYPRVSPIGNESSGAMGRSIWGAEFPSGTPVLHVPRYRREIP
jgi:hypothetical protein